MDTASIFALIGGVALFLFGMKIMGDGLKKVAGNKLELILYRLSNTTLKGVLLGTVVTSVIQSSCATSVMVVGFVNSGMMKLKQAVSVILGAILGTSITGWVICLSYIEGAGALGSVFSTATLTSAVALVGIVLYMFIKGPRAPRIGMILLGFAVLMTGMSAMSGAVGSLRDSDVFREMLSSLSNPLVGILVGTLITAILQSASASVGIIQALSVTGTVSIGAAVPLLLGVAIGASAPVLLSALGANTDGKRSALIYPFAATLSVMAVASVFYILDAIFSFSFLENITDPFVIAAINSVLRLAMVVITLPFCDIIEALVCLAVKEKAKGDGEFHPVLEDRFIQHPALAVEQSRTAINDMAEASAKALNVSFDLLAEYSADKFGEVEKLEKIGDKYEDALGTYLVKLTGRDLSEDQNRDVSAFLHTISDFERLSDHALNIAESAKELHDKGISMSPDARRELSVMTDALREIIRLATNAFITGDSSEAARVEPLEELVDQLCDELKMNHVERLGKGICTINQGFVFNDLLTDFERVSDHCSNIAVAMIELETDEFDTHEYLDRLKTKHSPEFENYFEEYKNRFAI